MEVRGEIERISGPIFMKSESEIHSVVSDSLQPHGLWNSPGQNTGVGRIPPTPEYWSSRLQGNFPAQELNWGLLNYRRILYQLSYQGSLIFTSDRNKK